MRSHIQVLIDRGRAVTDAQKRHVLDRIYEAWTSSPDTSLQRLGQLIVNSTPGERDLFFCEDLELAETIEDFARTKTET